MPWNPGRSMEEIERLRADPNYLPTPVKGKFWIPERDSIYGFPSDKEIHDAHARELKIMAQEAGVTLLIEQENMDARARLRRFDPPEEKSKPAIIKPVIEKPKPEPKPVVIKEPKAAKQKAPDGYITISSLAEMWEMTPGECRAALRNSDLEKPAFGWAFDPKDIPAIAKICGVR